MKMGDLVKITLQDFINVPDVDAEIVIGTIISISPSLPHIEPDPPLQPGPVYEVKVLTMGGEIWNSWIDQRDKIEILKEF